MNKHGGLQALHSRQQGGCSIFDSMPFQAAGCTIGCELHLIGRSSHRQAAISNILGDSTSPYLHHVRFSLLPPILETRPDAQMVGSFVILPIDHLHYLPAVLGIKCEITFPATVLACVQTSDATA
jgi:hypothetical protein